MLNLYMGIYDSSMVVLAALLASDALLRRAKGGDTPTLPLPFKLILVMVYVTPWITQLSARITGILNALTLTV